MVLGEDAQVMYMLHVHVIISVLLYLARLLK